MATTQENVRINFVTAFDGKALNNAKGSISSLEQLASRAAKSFAFLFAAQKVYQFGKASVQAFTQDQKAAQSLSNTLTNLGLGFKSLGVEDFIQNLEITTGVLDDKLRPAFATLARATGSVAKSQELLNLALDISAGTGRDLESVSLALSKGYLGQTTALGRLGAGLSKADLASKDFGVIQGKLTQLFAGQASTAAESYAGKIARIGVAYDNLKETVGQGLVQAFSSLSGSGGSLTKTLDMIQNVGYVMSAVIQGIGQEIGFLVGVIDRIFKLPIVNFLSKPVRAVFSELARIGKDSSFAETQRRNTKELEKVYAQQKKNLEVSKTQLSVDKAALALKQASKVLDLQQIQIYAAMQDAKGSDLDRLKLQQAILDGNAVAAQTLANKVLQANSLVMDLQGNIVADPLKGWVISSQDFLANLQASLNALKGIQAQTGTLAASSGVKAPTLTSGATPTAVSNLISTLSVNPNFTSIGGQGLINLLAAQAGQGVEVKVTIDPAAAVYGITAATQNASSNGTSVSTNRNNPYYLNPMSP